MPNASLPRAEAIRRFPEEASVLDRKLRRPGRGGKDPSGGDVVFSLSWALGVEAFGDAQALLRGLSRPPEGQDPLHGVRPEDVTEAFVAARIRGRIHGLCLSAALGRRSSIAPLRGHDPLQPEVVGHYRDACRSDAERRASAPPSPERLGELVQSFLRGGGAVFQVAPHADPDGSPRAPHEMPRVPRR